MEVKFHLKIPCIWALWAREILKILPRKFGDFDAINDVNFARNLAQILAQIWTQIWVKNQKFTLKFLSNLAPNLPPQNAATKPLFAQIHRANSRFCAQKALPWK